MTRAWLLLGSLLVACGSSGAEPNTTKSGAGTTSAASGSASPTTATPAAARSSAPPPATPSAASSQTASAPAASASAPPSAPPVASTPAPAEKPAATVSVAASAPPPAQPPARAFHLKPFVVGQWAKMKTSQGTQVIMESLYEVVAKEGPNFWLETEISGAATGVVQVLLDPEARTNPTPDSVKRVRGREGNGAVEEFTGPQLAAFKQQVAGELAIRVPDWNALAREDVTVPAGTFKGCYIYTTEQKIQGLPAKVKVWYHPDVPVVGWARNTAEISGQTVVMELQSYGETGAAKAF